MLSILFFGAGTAFLFFFLRKNKARSKAIHALFVLCFNLLLIETAAYGFLLYLIQRHESFFLIGHQKGLDRIIRNDIVDVVYSNRSRQNDFYEIDNELAYTIGKDKEYFRYFQKDGRIFYIKYGAKEGSVDKSSAQGIRALRNYSLVPAKDTLRVAAFGDSFVFGDYQPRHTVWTHYLENSVGNLEVLNFGVSGYGLGQSYLRYLKDGLRYNPDVIIFNYIQLGARDEVVSDVSKEHRLNLKHSAFYRVQLKERDGHLVTHAVTPFDYFDRSFMREQLVKILGSDPDKMFLPKILYRFSNTALIAKYFLLTRMADQRPIGHKENDVRLNVLLLENLLSVARANGTDVIFFCGETFASLPEPIRLKLFEYKDMVEYVNSTISLEAKFAEKNTAKEKLLNPTNHYNSLGNLYYAEVLAKIFAERKKWGNGDRQFKFDPKGQKFVTIGSNHP